MGMIKKQMFMEKFLYLLILFRPLLLEMPGWLFYLCVIALITIKNMKEGNTMGTIPILISLLVMILGDILESEFMLYLGVGVSGVGYWVFKFNFYHLPQTEHKVGLKQHIDQLGSKYLYWTDWYPVDNIPPAEQYRLKWNRTREFESLCGFANIKPKTFAFQLVKYFTSFIEKVKIQLYSGERQQTEKVIIFSHGNSTSPFMHSVLIRELAAKNQVYAPQHIVNKYIPGTIQQRKQFREEEIIQRAADLEFLIEKVPGNKKIILMGHSQGGATVIQAYHNPHVKKRVSEIVLLDPWFFPLAQETMEKPVQHPTLLIANQYWQGNKDMHERMQKFIQLHSKTLYFCLKKADHDSQTDIGFVIGNMSTKIKHPELTSELLSINLGLIKEFLAGSHENLPSQYALWNLGRDYKPQKWIS